MVAQMFFGTLQKMQLVPMPSTGTQRRDVFSSESGTLDRGGAYVTRSSGRHAEFDFNFGVREASSALAGLDIFSEYATGLWDDYVTVIDGYNPNNLIYFHDPMSARANLFAPQWAAPMRSLTGDWPWIGTYVSNAATAANAFNQPQRTVTFSVTSAINTLPTASPQRFVIPIPAGSSLRWGWSGSVTGTAVMRVEAHNRSTGAIVASNVAPLSATASTRIGNQINGDTYDYVTIGLARTSVVASTAVITSMMAQIHANTFTPALIGNHIDGIGHTGCEFDGEAISQEYIVADDFGNRRLKGMSFGLIEVGAWLP